MFLPFRSRTRRIVRLSIAALATWFVLCLPDTLFDRALAPVLFDHNGELLAARIAADGQWRFATGDSLPARFTAALMRFEDRNFFDHIGVHLPSMGRALLQNIRAGKVVSGGSTLTMQVIRLSRQNPNRSLIEKFTEIIRAVRLETRYSKAEILTFYCTHAPMGGNVVGVEAAAWRYFRCSPHQLSWAEAATLAVLPNAPGLIHPGRNRDRLKAKRDRLLHDLNEHGFFDEITLALSIDEALPGPPEDLPQLGMHLLQRLLREHPNTHRFSSTIDMALQRKAEEIVETHSARLRENLVYNAAALVLDARTGDVLAYVGNSNSGVNAGHVDIISAPRSPGSSLKPFLFAAMLDEGMLTPDALQRDVPVNLGGFSPRNFSDEYLGVVPASRALARSLNVPAVLQLKTYGVSAFHAKLLKMGFKHLNKPSAHYGLSLILGGGETSLWELSSAWLNMTTTLHIYREHDGRYQDVLSPRCLGADGYAPKTPAINHEQPTLFSAGAVYATLKALEEVRRPDDVSGWETMSSARRIAWKTGTSYGYRDAWAIGATPEYIVAVWTGNADGTGRPGVIGTRASAPLMFNLFDALPATSSFAPPYDDLIEAQICSASGFRASRHCSETRSAHIPQRASEAPICPHHTPLLLSPDRKFRVHHACEHDGMLEARFVLPPIEGWYYRRNHPDYAPPPPFRADCNAESSNEELVIVYPAEGSKLTRARDLEGTLQPLVAEAISRRSDAVLHWHLNDSYLGSTRRFHQMALAPESAGKHSLTVLNEDGDAHRIEFTLGGKP